MKAKLLVCAVPVALAAALLTSACAAKAPADHVRASGNVEATEVQVSPKVGGQMLELKIDEGDRVAQGQVIAVLDTTDAGLALQRAKADRDQASAQLALLEAGSREEDIRQAQAQVSSAEADAAGARDDLASAETDLKRFETLLKTNSGTEKQRDDAATRKKIAQARLQAAEDHVRAAREGLVHIQKGPRPQEISAARARVAAAQAQIATLEQSITDASVIAPLSGIVSQKFADAGEILAPRTPIVSIVDLDHAWADIYIDEPLVPRIRLGQSATVFNDAGGPGLKGTVTFISPKAEFTPKNVQTAEERSKLVYRIKVTVDNSKGILKQGMPVEADVPLAAR
jgi:membrane fusion protein YbhG